MVYSEEDKVIIKVLCQENGYGAKRLSPNSPDLNPVEHTEAGGVSHMHSRVTTSVTSRRLVEEWQKFDQKIIDWVIKQWHPCLRSCSQQGGGHFEHRL